jgi:lysophospholipase L1-like esterase
MKNSLSGSDPTAWVNAQIDGFGRDMKTLISGIRGRSSKARIVILNLPNLAALPYSNGLSAADKRTLQMIAVGLNAQVNAMAAQGATVVDMMCDSRLYNPAIFSSDGFHPNDSGYALFADLLYAAAATTSATAPQSSCSFMTMY